MAATRFIIGIDLGTTNSVMAWAETFEDRKPEVHLFRVPQLVAPGTVEERDLLPSFVYLPGEHELPGGSLALPWSADGSDQGVPAGGGKAGKGKGDKAAGPTRQAVGEFAREQGRLVADRLVSSSKSWLCHSGVDRRAAILPWGTGDEAIRISPVEAARRVLSHMKAAWNDRMARRDPTAAFEKQEIVLTVPASFDEIARELTVEAARDAGIDEANLVLLEEPQAAFYAWIGENPEERLTAVQPGDKILVVDMGGGTTDLSLFSAAVGEESIAFERTAVGEHLLLGGDNIDLNLARIVEQELKDSKTAKKLSVRQWQALLQSCRSAKERLLAEDGPDEVPIVLPGKGSKLIGGSLKTALKREGLVEKVLDGFFPLVERGDAPRKEARGGLQEFGLPFESDPAVTRHLLAFLEAHCVEDGELQVPRALLFNGGVFKTALLRERVERALGSWMGDSGAEPMVLESADLDLAVARGAATYGLVRRGYGVRIRGGLPRAYFLGVETGEEVRKALCLIPRGMEPGESVAIEGHDLELVTRRPVSFPLYSSTTREGDQVSDLVTINEEDFRELPPLMTVLKLGRKSKRTSIPVQMQARLTEIGTLELSCRSTVTDHDWRLNFTVRSQSAAGDEEGPSEDERAKTEEALNRLRDAFQGRRSFNEAVRRLDGLVKELEDVLGAGRDEWSLYSVRALWDKGLLQCRSARDKSPRHEARWLNLAGFSLRPGFGSAQDEHRVRTLWKVFLQGMEHENDPKVRLEWFVVWRRIAGGLNRGQQEELVSRLGKSLKLRPGKVKGARREEQNEAWRVAASLENLPPARKQELGEQLIEAWKQGHAPRCAGWALGRIGARIPIYGTLDNQLSPAVVSTWIETLTRSDDDDDKALPESLIAALVQMARLTGDRTLDIDETLRGKVTYRLRKSGADARYLRPLNEAVALEAREHSTALGDSLPVGLRIGG